MLQLAKVILGLILLSLSMIPIGCVGYGLYCLFTGNYHAGFLAMGIALVSAFSFDVLVSHQK